jgi:hypothetical protein
LRPFEFNIEKTRLLNFLFSDSKETFMKTAKGKANEAIQFLAISNLLVIAGCGSVDGKFDSAAAHTTPQVGVQQTPAPAADESPVSFAVTSAGALPACSATRVGSLAYVKDEKAFYTCESTGWMPQDILPKDPLAVVARWEYHIDSYVDAPNIMDEAVFAYVHIGDIEIIKYANGSASFFLSGVRLDYTGTDYTDSHDHIYNGDFSYSGFISDTKSDYTKVFKIAASTDARLRVRINLSSPTPSFKAVVDIDGIFSNNTDQPYVLTKTE